MRSGSTTNNVVTAFDYRAWGGLQKADFANGRRVALGYDQKRSQLASLKLLKTDNTDVVSNLSYDYYNGGNNNGRIQKITDADSSYTTTFGYDDYNRLSSASAAAYTRSYSYDGWGNLTGVTSTGAGESGSYSLSYAANGSGGNSQCRRDCLRRCEFAIGTRLGVGVGVGLETGRGLNCAVATICQRLIAARNNKIPLFRRWSVSD